MDHATTLACISIIIREIYINILYRMSKRRSGLANDRRAYGCNICNTLEQNITIIYGPGSSYTENLTQVSIPGTLYDAGSSVNNLLDDGDVPITMGQTNFYFFGNNYKNQLFWSSNNALIFGTTNPQLVDIPSNSLKSILLGNYDRKLQTFFYSNTSNTNYSITTILVSFFNYYLDVVNTSQTYQYKIRLIKENIGYQRQFIEVYVISSPPSPGYSSAAISYPSGVDINGNPMDSNGNTIDQSKNSPYNITNGTNFLNPCGSTFSLTSPPANTSFVFSSDSTGSIWSFTNNSHVNV
jgi:hypothetical protein